MFTWLPELQIDLRAWKQVWDPLYISIAFGKQFSKHSFDDFPDLWGQWTSIRSAHHKYGLVWDPYPEPLYVEML